MSAGFDTSGGVFVPFAKPEGELKGSLYVWSDLDAFTQGYVEAAWSAVRDLRRDAEDRIQMNLGDLGFRHLSPEALAMILRDCEGARRALMANDGDGAWFWAFRQRNNSPVFPPLLVTLNDDGKVVLSEVSQ